MSAIRHGYSAAMTLTAPTTHEQPYWAKGLTVVGVDEVGRGALAGPVTVGAVVLAPGVTIDGARDSKALSHKQRIVLDLAIRSLALDVGIGDASASEIDQLGLTGALQRAAQRALDALKQPSRAILLDGRHDFLKARIATELVVKGDAASQSIAAASIVAKVHRDRLMTAHDATYPLYGFAGHKGYGAQTHREAIRRYGVCPLHRMSFAPCSGHEQLSLIPTDLPREAPDQGRQ